MVSETKLDIVDFYFLLESLDHHFGTILVIKWDTDALKGTLEGPRMDFE